MAKKIIYEDADISTRIEIELNSANEVMISCLEGNINNTFFFQKHSELSDFIRELEVLAVKMKENSR